MSPAETAAARVLADEARARANAAKPGPWTVANVLPRDMREVATAGARFIRAPGERDSDPRQPPRDAPADYYDRGGRDASFIAHARTDVPALADAITAALDALAAAEARAERAAQWQALAEAATATHAADRRDEAARAAEGR